MKTVCDLKNKTRERKKKIEREKKLCDLKKKKKRE
jgi:hypothetical protein